MLRRENLIRIFSRLNRLTTRTTAGRGYVRPTPWIVWSRENSMTSILPRQKSEIARVHDSTRSGLHSESRYKMGAWAAADIDEAPFYSTDGEIRTRNTPFLRRLP